MFANFLAFSYTIAPPSLESNSRTLFGTVLYAFGAIVGWPFSLALSIPFVFEELFLHGTDAVPSEQQVSWLLARFGRFLTAGGVAALLFVRLSRNHILRADPAYHISRFLWLLWILSTMES